jgi:drug/metabolite transporter (DMT)-like permease
VDAVLLSCCSAFLFGAMTVALRLALNRGTEADVGAALTILPALATVLPFVAARGDLNLGGIWPFVLAGILGPGMSQLLFTLAVRDAGPSRTSVVVGTAPLFSVAIALAFLDEPVRAALMLGAVLIVLGGLLLVGERGRPAHFKLAGLVFAFTATAVFAVRDNLVRWLATDTAVNPPVAAAATLGSGCLCVCLYVLVARGRAIPLRRLPVFVPAGVFFGLSYVALFEAYYRGRVTVVSPLVATESLWGVLLSALILRRSELVGPRLLAGAALVVAGGALIGAFR